MTSNSGRATGAARSALVDLVAGPASGGHLRARLVDRLAPDRLLSGTALLGLIGAVLLTTMAVGAGGILVNDPLIGDGALSWIRYGHGHDLATVGLYLGVGMMVWAWVRLGRDVLNGIATAQQVKVAGITWVAPLVLSPPLFTRDVYSYLAQGALARRGIDPYLFGPSELPPGAVADNVHYVWQTTPAPYGPLFIFISKLTSAVTGDHLILGVIGMRLVLLAGFAALIYALPELARQLGGNPTVALWLVITNPLTVIHLVGGPHNDLLMTGLLALGTLLVLQRRPAAGIVVGTMAMGIKASAGVVLPFLVWIWAAQLPENRRSQLLRAGSGGVAVVAMTFTGITLLSGVGLGWVPALDAPSLIVNWMSLPTAAGEVTHALASPFGHLSEHPFIEVCRLLGAGVFVAIFVRQCWLARHGGPPQAVRGAARTLLWAALLAPATLPWYFSWALVLAAVLPWRRPLTLAGVLAGCTWLVLCTYPTGESAYSAWPYQLAMIAVALLAACSLLRPDPLGLRKRIPVVDPSPTVAR